MMHHLILGAMATMVLIIPTTIMAQNAGECGGGKKCPEDTPCCSQYGACGVGAYCLGGCDPLNSHSLDSCTPAPICRSQDYKLSSLDGITSNQKYLGDASTSNWVSSGTPKVFEDQVLLTLSEDGQSSSGTLLASTSYLWYGKISAEMKSSRGAGVVSAFILLSDVKDEIDFEFVGTDLENAQSNYYYQGITNYANGMNLSVANGNTFDTYHRYEIDWKPDSITWSIDGKVLRTVEKKDTFNKTTNSYHYPQTPSRVQLSLWPGGLSKNAEGTIAWAGGLVDWNSEDIQTNGYYYAMFKDVRVECYDPPSGAKISGSKAYVYTSPAGDEKSVAITNDRTILKSLLGTGTDMDKDYPKPEPKKTPGASKTSDKSSSAPSATPTKEVATIPGLTGAGPGTNGQRGGAPSGGTNSGSDGSGGSGENSDGSSSDSGSVTESGSDSGSVFGGTDSSSGGDSESGFGGFSQGAVASTNSSNAPQKGERVLQGSMFAIFVAIMGMLVI
jgi:beta-glucanase (GH16 family)